MIRRKNIFDRIGSLIPGYKGYSEREGRRNTDKVLREEISKKMYEIEKKINTLNSKIKYSPQGSTGFFSDEEIKEDELLKVYEIDLDIFNLINQIAQKIMDENFVVIENLLKDFEKIIFDRSIFISKF